MFTVVHLTFPRLLCTNRIFRSCPRYRRTHISHMHRDRMHHLIACHHTMLLPLDDPTQAHSTPSFEQRLDDKFKGAASTCSTYRLNHIQVLPRLGSSNTDFTSSGLCATEIHDITILLSLYLAHLSGGGHSLADDSASEADSASPSLSFVPAEWIGRGIEWTDNLPKEVLQAWNNARYVPPSAHSLFIPPSHLPVTDLLDQFLDNLSIGVSDTITHYFWIPRTLSSLKTRHLIY